MQEIIKRIIDIFGSLLGFAILIPFMAFIALLVQLKIGSPVIFRQKRLGLHGKPFIIYKFRTMTDARDTQGNLLPDKQRITRLGRLLRKASLDELPELWNVVIGDMSLVGPRPLFMQYLPHYTKREQLRHKMRPGITGLSQVSGRNRLQWNNRLELDARYAETHTFALDIWILIMTIIQVLQQKDVTIVPGTHVKPLHLDRKIRS